jgi:sugar phosphate isomerase/epimerase
MNNGIKIIFLLPVIMLCINFLPIAYASEPNQAKAQINESWRLCMQAYTFKEFTFFEAVDKTKSLGLKYIEAYPQQSLSKEKSNVKIDHNMSADIKKEVQQKLSEAGIKLINYGVVALPNYEVECRKVFNFAKEMGIETIVSEPPEDAFDLVEKLCEEYKINVAIHNHPKSPVSHYWDPNTVLKVCQGRSPRIGACADTGHWMRSGINPLEAIKKLKGRIISLHLKDLNEFGNPKAHDCVWGTGAAKTNAILAELSSQNFKGVFSIEYEYNWLNSLPEITDCVTYFKNTTKELRR